MKRNLLFFAALFLLITFTDADVQAQNEKDDEGDKITGLWLPSNGKARIQVYKGRKTGRYFGRIVWLREPNDEETGKPKTDKNNPDESKRDKPLLGYVMLRGFEYNADEEVWENGTIYDPNNGSTYNCVIEMKNKNVLEVRGYIGVSLFGRTDTWKRLKMKGK